MSLGRFLKTYLNNELLTKLTFLLAIVTLSYLYLFSFAAPAKAVPPTNFQTSLIIPSGLNGPTGFEIAPDGRIFILQRTGEVKIYKNGQLLSQNFALLPSAASGDRGLIGIAFDPDFLTNHYVYFYYTSTDLHNYLVRYDAGGDIGTNGPVILYHTTDLSFQLHVGGTIRFGPDDKLYLSIGDNGYSNNAQDLSNPHGKILRLNKDGSIPPDNPFVNQPGAKPEIWAYGFRNPFRFQFDSVNGRLYEGDVGEATWEEINYVRKGKNYGWPLCEGFCQPPNPQFTDPIYSYNHNGGSAAVVGGPIYHDQMFPSDYQGSLFIGDYAQGWIKRLTLNADGSLKQIYDFDLNAGSVVDLKVDHRDGSLYYVTYYPGRLYRISYSTGIQVPVANATADVTKGVEPLTIHFSSLGSSDYVNLPLSFSWDFGDNTSSQDANPTKIYTKKGTYIVQLRVSNGTYTGLAVPIVIQVGLPPIVTVGTPMDNSTYKAGDQIHYTVSAVDGAGFDISDGSISTTIIFHHQTHIHPFLGPLIGRTGTFTIPNTGETSADTWFELDCTATDTSGLATTKVIKIYPLKSKFSLTTNIPGLQLFLDGIPVSTPITIDGVVGFLRELSAPLVQFINGVLYQLDHWSDLGALKHLITTASTDTTYTAYFNQVPPFKGEYFTNKNLEGNPALTRSDNLIDFNWGDQDSPDPSIPHNNFSARWTKRQHFTFGRYKFTTSTDDGVRLWLDGKLLIDQWHDQVLTSYSTTVDLSNDNHDIKMEYFQSYGGAIAKFNWEATSDQPSPSPSPTATPTPTPTPQGIIYDDALTPGWLDWSWGGNVNLQATNPVFSGQYSIAFTALNPWAGFHIHSDAGLDLTPFKYINFAAQATQLNQHYAVVLYGLNNQQLGNQLLLSNYGGDPSLGLWQIYHIPLADFNASGKLVKDIVIQSWSPNAQPTVYFDQLQFVAASSPTPTPTPTPTATPSPIPTPTPTPTPELTNYQGEYWNLTNNSSIPPSIPATTPNLTRNDPQINFNWNFSSPDPIINGDHFIVRWTKSQQFESAVYRFKAVSDDGVRVYIDNQLIIDQWKDQAATTFIADLMVTAGIHNIRVEYYQDGGGAIAKFDYQKKDSSVGDFTAQYFDNQSLIGSPKISRHDGAVNFNWGLGGSPDPSIPPTHFSARWTKVENFSAGNYTFILMSDDGVRFWIDNQLVVDDWTDHSMRFYQPTIQLSAGLHTIKIEYYQNDGNALIIFTEL